MSMEGSFMAPSFGCQSKQVKQFCWPTVRKFAGASSLERSPRNWSQLLRRSKLDKYPSRGRLHPACGGASWRSWHLSLG
jgi:hypothetical protein